MLFYLTSMGLSQSTHLLIYTWRLTVHHKDWLIFLVKLIDPVDSVIMFLSQRTLLRWLTFLLASLTVTLTVLPFQIYFSLMALLFVIQWTFLLREFLILLSSQFLSIPLQTKKGMPSFITKFITILVLIWIAFPII